MFSKNDIHMALDLVKSMYSTADEFVLVDSSNKERRAELAKAKKSMKLNKLKIFYCVPIGFPDPLRMYGLSKCTSEWVALMDTDERFSPMLKKDLKKLISDSKAPDAFALRRYEEKMKDPNNDFFTWQTRLFKRDKVQFRGIRHEQAIVSGKTTALKSSSYYIEHHEAQSGHTGTESGKIEIYEDRLSYELYNKRMLEYLGKLVVPEGDIEKTAIGKAAKGFLMLYQKLGMKSKDKEASNFDYFMFGFLKDIGYTLQGRDPKRVVIALKDRHADIKKIRKWKSSPEGREAFEIAKIINRIGVIKFLHLDEEKHIKELNRKYKDKEGGIALLLKLMAEEYKRNWARKGSVQ